MGSLQVSSQVAFQVVLVCLDIAFLIFAWTLLTLFSTINNCATQIAVALSSIVGIWDTIFGEWRRKLVRRQTSDVNYRDSATNIPLLDQQQQQQQPPESPQANTVGSPQSAYDREYLEQQQIQREQQQQQQQPLPDTKNEYSVSQPNPVPFYDIPNSPTTNKANVDEGTPNRVRVSTALTSIFAAILFLSRYVPMFLHIVFGYIGKPIPSIIVTPLDDASNNVTLPSFYSEITQPLYDISANYTLPDEYDTQSARPYFPLFTNESIATLQGSTFFHKHNVTCFITDRFEYMIMQNGYLVHYSAYPSLPFLPMYECKNDTTGYTFYYTNSNHSKPTEYEGYPTALKKVLDVGQNVTGISIVPEDDKVYATTVFYDSFTFDNYRSPSNETFDRLLNESFPWNQTLSPENDWAQMGRERVIINMETLDYCITLMRRYFQQGTPYVISYHYTHPETADSNIRNFTRTMLSLNTIGGFVSISKMHYRTRQVSYDISSETNARPQPHFLVANDLNEPTVLNAQVYSLITNTKVAPAVAGAVLKTTGYQSSSLQQLSYGRDGPLIYDIRALCYVIFVISGISLMVLFLVYIIWANRPKGIPFYYALLHEYHQKTSGYGGWCYKSIFDIIRPAYEGHGFVVSQQANHIGVLDGDSIRNPPQKGFPYGGKPDNNNNK